MTDAKLRSTILDVVNQELKRTGPPPEGDLSEVLNSVQRLTLLVALEDHFEICFAPEAEATLRTFDDVVTYISSQRNG